MSGLPPSSPAGIGAPPRQPAPTEEEPGASSAAGNRFESDLRGSLANDSLSEDERRQIEDERARAEAAAELREQDYQLAYAIDILKGLSALGPAQ